MLHDINNCLWVIISTYVCVKLCIFYILTDINECLIGIAGCRPFGISECENTVGSFQCNCPQGYRKIGDITCTGEYSEICHLRSPSK